VRLTDLEKSVGGLSNPGKMPGPGWSISAFRCVTGSALAKREGTPCASCYARKGRYVFPAVQAALERRFRAWESDRAAWRENMIALLNLKAEIYSRRNRGERLPFRWFDSGDLQNVGMLADIVDVAKRTPAVIHWLPTQERAIVRVYLRNGGRIPENLSVRVSSSLRNIVADGLRSQGVRSSLVIDKGASVATGVTLCPAPKQGNSCRDCRACWVSSRPIAYTAH